MKKILYMIKVGLGIFIVMAAAYALSPFASFLELLFGTGLILSGVLIGVLLEKRRRLFFLFSSFCFLLTFLLYFVPFLSFFQYFAGGFLIYFACTMMLVRKKLLFLEVSGKI